MPAYSKIHSDGVVPGEKTLDVRNVEITNKAGRRVRTSMRLEPYVWDALYDVAAREGRTYHELCDLIAHRKSRASTLTAAVRLFILIYFRIAADERGHAAAGHGQKDVKLFDRIFHEMIVPRAKPGQRRRRAEPPAARPAADTPAQQETRPPET